MLRTIIIVGLWSGILTGCSFLEEQFQDLQADETVQPTANRETLVDPARLVGLTGKNLRRILGKEASSREEPPARIWHYHNDKCAADFFFYLDLESQSFRVVTYDIKILSPEAASTEKSGGGKIDAGLRGEPEGELANQRCLGQIQVENGGKQ